MSIEHFFDYVRERYTIMLKKNAGDKPPWTKDPALQKYRFCNVFREDDRTTIWMREHVRKPYENNFEKLLAAVVLFRMFNRISTGEAVFSQLDLEGGNAFDRYFENGKTKQLKKAILALLPSGPYVTGSYIIAGPGGQPKLDGMLEVVHNFYMSDLYLGAEAGIGNFKTLQSAHEFFKQFPFFGSFHSYEIVTDLRHTPLLKNAPDIMTWCAPGPGCKRGLNRLMGRHKKAREWDSTEDLLKEMAIILDASRDPKHWPSKWPAWEMRDVEHGLCEFDKISRVRSGEGRPRGTYS